VQRDIDQISVWMDDATSQMGRMRQEIRANTGRIEGMVPLVERADDRAWKAMTTANTALEAVVRLREDLGRGDPVDTVMPSRRKRRRIRFGLGGIGDEWIN